MAVHGSAAGSELTGRHDSSADVDDSSPSEDATSDVEEEGAGRQSTQPKSEDVDERDSTITDDEAQDASDAEPVKQKRRIWSVFTRTALRSAISLGMLVVIALGGLVALWSYRAYDSRHGQQQRQLFLEVGRQGAINLTTIDYHHAREDVARILSSSTGDVYQNFEQRADPFIKLVQQVKATTKGTVTEAGLESAQPDEAQVLLAVQVDRWVNDAPQDPSYFRMRVDVKYVGADVKMSNVEFVP
jgi:Mce-associated membrane protein